MAEKKHIVNKTITLPDKGTSVEIDYEALRADIKTRKDMKTILNLGKGDEYDRWVARYTSLSYDELEGLSIQDYIALDKAVGEAVQAVFGPN